MNLSNLGTTKITILVLAVITGIIHLTLGDTIFLLNGVGYLALVAIYVFAANMMKPDMFAPIRPMLGWIFIGYTAITIVLYFAFNWPDVWGPLGLFTKLVEVVLIVQLLRDR